MSEEGYLVRSGFSTISRTVYLVPGRRYIISPINEKKLRHRDRECILLDIVKRPNAIKPDEVAKVRFEDNNHIGYPDLGDLVPLDERRKDEVF